jgi:hypothetical protein
MTSFDISDENRGAGAALSQIVIEAEGLGDPGTLLCLRVDSHLIARNLTTTQIKFLVCEILDRIDLEEEPQSSERQSH